MIVKNKKPFGFTLRSRACRGFTLIELLVVISVLGIIAAFAVSKLSSADKIARDLRRKSDLNQYRTALENYAVKTDGVYIPCQTLVGIDVICGSGKLLTTGGYMSSCPNDPLTGTVGYWYRYQTDAGGINYVLFDKLENGKYWYVCSNGKAQESITEPSITTCTAL